MENLKIFIRNPHEKERAEKALFALGFKPDINCFLTYGDSQIIATMDNAAPLEHSKCGTYRAVTLTELEEMAAKAAHGEGLNSFETMVQEKEQATTCDPNTIRPNELEWQHFLSEATKDVTNILNVLPIPVAQKEGYARGFTEYRQSEEAQAKTLDLNTVFFVYQKLGKTEVLKFEEAKEKTDILADDGWEHVATLNAIEYIRYNYQQESEAQKRYEVALEYIEKNKGYELCDYIDAVQQALRIAAGME
jgi:hypothetical protein